jgi:hypothetical protein
MKFGDNADGINGGFSVLVHFIIKALSMMIVCKNCAIIKTIVKSRDRRSLTVCFRGLRNLSSCPRVCSFVYIMKRTFIMEIPTHADIIGRFLGDYYLKRDGMLIKPLKWHFLTPK